MKVGNLDETSGILSQVADADEPAYGYKAASGTFGDMPQMGLIDPAKVTRLALQNAASIASLILTTDCLMASVPTPGAS